MIRFLFPVKKVENRIDDLAPVLFWSQYLFFWLESILIQICRQIMFILNKMLSN
ncbi:hypothetical protein SAMN04488024_10149 [Pedobacter soli]|uniref:Uncharacterized protein n=1 Tax=Pedobacter soli TaxID=390242 RepID=A0A1G6I7U3_9SPHI|nr:hypothetical protein SAMN04488024_10149 [Pedobacter soli]